MRKALQRNARGAFVVEGFDPESVLEAVRRDLCPHDPNPLRAELYAVNVYGPGDHFVTHKDTPRGDDMIGTLVLCATRSFYGGEMTFTRSGARRRVACAAGLRGVVVKEAVWLAFFGDVDHAVETVTGGDRVTLTWLLRRSEGAPGPRPVGRGSRRGSPRRCGGRSATTSSRPTASRWPSRARTSTRASPAS